MYKILLTILATLLFSNVAKAGISGTVGVDFSENASDDIIATKDIDLNISSDIGFASIAVITNSSDQLVLDEYAVGVKHTHGTVSYGDQGDIFIGGGLEVVGANTLENPSADGESIILTYDKTSIRTKFTDTGTDVTDFDTIQLSQFVSLGKVEAGVSVDHNIDTDNNIWAVSGAMPVTEKLSLSSVATYDDDNTTDKLGYEVIASVENVSLFVNGSDDDSLQNAGAGYKSSYKDLDWYVEAGYNYDSKDVTPAAGISVNF